VEEAGEDDRGAFAHADDPQVAGVDDADGQVGDLELQRQRRQEAGAAPAEYDHVAHRVHQRTVQAAKWSREGGPR
jgi:hypothetical protein